jgi:DNA processing protein
MSEATIVIESADRGGSLITANMANDYNRDVFAFQAALPINTVKANNDKTQQNVLTGLKRRIQKIKDNLTTCLNSAV